MEKRGSEFQCSVTRSVTIGIFILMVHISQGVKWQNTTRSLSGEPELTEGTWLQLMCCAPSRSCCPKFQSNRVYEGILEFTKVFRSTLEKTEKLEVCANGCTMVDIRTDPIIHDLFVYVSMGMNVSTKQKDNMTVMGQY